MKKYRISGFIDEIGACQTDLEANSKEEAKQIAITDYEYYIVVNVSELEEQITEQE